MNKSKLRKFAGQEGGLAPAGFRSSQVEHSESGRGQAHLPD